MNNSAQVVDFGVASIAREVAKLPGHWAFIPVGGKKAPQYTDWQKSRFQASDFDNASATGEFSGAVCKAGEPNAYTLPARYVKAAGVLCGEPSGGLLFFDHDGPTGDPKILELSGCNEISEAMPKTAVVTSGRQGRYQAIYQVPEVFWPGITTTKIGTKFELRVNRRTGNEESVAVEGIEFRWTGAQSVVIGSHPESEGYRWIYHPSEVPVAEAPTWMLEAMLTEAEETNQAKTWAEFDKAFTLPCGTPVDLLVACSPKTRQILETGQSDRGRNDTGAMIARDLIGTAAYLSGIGQRYTGDPKMLFDSWCSSTGLDKDQPKGQPRTIWAKAEKDRPSPSLNPTMIEGCLKSWVWKNTEQAHSNVQQLQQADLNATQAEVIEGEDLTAEDLRKAVSEYAEIKDPFERHMVAKRIKTDFRATNSDLSNLSRALTPSATTGAEQIDDIVGGALAEIRRRADGGTLPVVNSGFVDLDQKIIGFKNKHLIVLGGRAAMGKTAMAVALSLNAGLQGKRVLFISLEMTKEEISERLLANLASIDSTDLQTGNIPKSKWVDLEKAAQVLQGLQIIVDDTPRLPVVDIEALAAKNRSEIVFVDHALKLDAPGRDDRERVVFISGFLKDMAKRIDAPVVLLSQINRDVQTRSDKRPSISDLKQSGSLEEDADLILLMYREDYYDEQSPNKGISEVIVGKHRNGAVGTVKLLFEPQYTRFRNLAAGREYLPPSQGDQRNSIDSLDWD
ncbi:DnaB-like helicase C-terminal domain-containing protein [Adonisia turfae]|uniref:SF4 helicase domain-containing protein n=1 Tax=Adonisia turfae CCMR0081 TaxID=2292702 RepID=A0A6M0RFE7_9CYAN|nr:DnaB-like helicase C-terminal domain-containing protein [Adonisia turfae]NEZ54967.1 hypothetical protein [Adonisia turfae CCMR0081]